MDSYFQTPITTEYDLLKQKIEQLTQKVNTQQSQIQSLKQTNKILKQKYTESQKKTIKYDRVKTRINTCVDRLLFCISFLQYLGAMSCVYGSLVRKWIECTLHFNKIDSTNTIGDVSTSNINILLHYSHIVNKMSVSSQFYNLLHEMNTLRIYAEQKYRGIQTPTIYKYKFIGIQYTPFKTDEGETIPKANLYFSYGTDFLTVELLAWKPDNYVDFTINNFMLTQNGLQSILHHGSFFKYIEHIHFQQTDYIQRIDLLQYQAFPAGVSLLRKDKLTYLTKVYELISHCYLKIYASDYKLIKFLCIQIEQKDECVITGCKPPYPTVLLVCGHSISLMAYKGILFSTPDTDTQSIRCPMCRNDLKIQFKQQILERSLQYYPFQSQLINKLSQSSASYPFINKDASENL